MRVEFLAHAKTKESLPKAYLPEIAFLGRSNSGKSSLINTLLGQKVARSSSTPGRTQGLCFFKVRPNLVFVDFPGFGYAKTSKQEKTSWVEVIEAYASARHTWKATVWIYDIRRDPDALDFQMQDWLLSSERPFCIALSKVDTLNKSQWLLRKNRIKEILKLPEEQLIYFSSRTQEGVKTLWKIIDQKY